MGPGSYWDNSLYPPSGYRLGESCENSSLRNYQVVVFVKFIGLAFNQPPHVWSACGIEVVACTRTTHSRDTVGGGSGVLLVQGL